MWDLSSQRARKVWSIVARISVAVTLVVAIQSSSHAAGNSRPMAPAKNGNSRGYLFTKFMTASYDGGTADCPDGMAMSLIESHLALLPPDKRPLVADIETKALAKILMRPGDEYYGHNICSAPTEYEYTGFRTIEHDGPGVGMNLDGTTDGGSTANTCSHKKFSSVAGGGQVDNQLWRALGCIVGWRPNGPVEQSGGTQSGWSVLMEITDRNTGNGDVDVDFYAGEDTVDRGADGEFLPGQSIGVKRDPKYHASTHGAIVDGILTTDPVDFTYRLDAQVMHSDPQIKAARVRVQFQPDGSIKGIMGGYFDAERFYADRILSMTFGGDIRTGTNCPGLYAALHQLADGYRDPKTGECSALSGAFFLEGIPAFVIHSGETQRDASAITPGSVDPGVMTTVLHKMGL